MSGRDELEEELRELEVDDGPQPAGVRLYDVDELDRCQRVEARLLGAVDLMTSALDDGSKRAVLRIAAYYARRRERILERRAAWSARELERSIRSKRRELRGDP